MFIRLIKSSLFKNTSFYVIANALNQSLPILLLPILTQYLTKYQYGVFATLQTLLSILAVIVTFGTSGALSRAFFEYNKKELSYYLMGLIYIISSCTIFLFIFLLLTRHSIDQIFNVPSEWLLIMMLFCWSNAIIFLLLTIWQMENKPILFGIYRILQTLISFLLSLLLVVKYLMNLEGQLYSMLFSTFLFSLTSLIILKAKCYISIYFNLSYIKNAIFYGYPLMIHEVAAILVGLTGVLFINVLVNVTSSGPYLIALTIGQVISLINSSFNQAWVPYVFDNLNQKSINNNVRIVIISYCYMVSILVISILGSLTTPQLLIYFIGKDFYEMVSYLPWIFIAFALNGMYRITAIYLFYSKKTKLLALSTISSAIIYVICCYILTNLNGPIGAAQSLFISQLFMFILTFILSAKVYSMPWLFFLRSAN